MTIGFRQFVRDGKPMLSAFNFASEPVTFDEIDRAIAAIYSTGNSHFGFLPEKLPVVVAALRLAGFEVK